ncbi:MAG TPA: maleate cis-trans isomerase, partial [Candidatus Paceibacterota bacterium]|nr:maleate cis-trans isomerase [Candidatus Paceibacterota bacterium]
HDWITSSVPDEADVVMVAGNGFRAVGIIEALEASLRRPAPTANQVLFWAALRASGYDVKSISHYGSLFRQS